MSGFNIALDLERAVNLANSDGVCGGSLLCACDGRKGVLTNCADTASLVRRSRCCKLPDSRRLTQSSPRKTVVCPVKCSCGACESRETPWTVAILRTSMKRQQLFRQKRMTWFANGDDFPEQTRRAICLSDSHQPWSPAEFDTRKDDFRRKWT